MKPGLFVTLEGGEGAGKSTLASRLQDALKASYEVVLTREPGGTSISEEIRKLVLHYKGHVANKSELFLFLAARIQHLDELIRPAVTRGAVVICDRFTDSTIAYQGEARGLGRDYVASCCSLATGGYEPDITFYIDIDPKVGILRTHKRTKSSHEAYDRLENEALGFHEKVRAAYQKLAAQNPERIITLDGTQSPDALFSAAYAALLNRLPKA
ncbi:MAG: dTMP kinase [Verrucomicrobia bacterium]|nr:dTMP kinase [Verrucomicrobiota bacterium]